MKVLKGLRRGVVVVNRLTASQEIMPYKTKNKEKDEETTLIRVYKKTQKNLAKKIINQGGTVADHVLELEKMVGQGGQDPTAQKILDKEKKKGESL